MMARTMRGIAQLISRGNASSNSIAVSFGSQFQLKSGSIPEGTNTVRTPRCGVRTAQRAVPTATEDFRLGSSVQKFVPIIASTRFIPRLTNKRFDLLGIQPKSRPGAGDHIFLHH